MEETTASKKKILLVEDDESLANTYLMRLQAEGFDVRRVANGEDALAAAKDYHPNLIVLDAMMPKVSGFDVLDILRNTPETANLKIVMLTALSQESDKQREALVTGNTSHDAWPRFRSVRRRRLLERTKKGRMQRTWQRHRAGPCGRHRPLA